MVCAMACAMACAMSTPVFAGQSLPIIPGAHGFGMDTPAGSGRHLDEPETRVIKVTNLNTKGPGSLRAALETEGPRVVVFEVSGNIDFTPHESLAIRNPYVTVAGQTAPSPGITLKGCEVHIATHDVLLQHLRFRVGDLEDPEMTARYKGKKWTQWSERDCMKVRSSAHDVVIDHCSFSWSTDENIQSTGHRLTFRQNLISEGLISPLHNKGAHSKGMLLIDQSPRDQVIPQDERDSRHVAVIGNLFAFNTDRNPTAQGGGRVAIINNYIYGALQRPAIGIGLSDKRRKQGSQGGGIRATVTHNHFDRVPRAIRSVSDAVHTGKVFLGEMLYGYVGEDGQYHEAVYQDPWTASSPEGRLLIYYLREKDTSKGWTFGPPLSDTGKVKQPPVMVPGLKIRPTKAVRDWTLANAGARPADRDAVDERVIQQVRSRTGELVASQADVGGWPELAENRRELTVPDNPSADDDNDGYTNLEEWLHGFAAEVEPAAE